MLKVEWGRQPVCLCCLVLLLGAAPASAQAIAWEGDYARALAAARAWGRPLLVCVERDGCPWCRDLHTSTFADAEVVAAARDFLPLKIDAHRQRDLAQALSVRGTPALILAAPDGAIVHTVEGYVDAAQMRQHVAYALSRLRRQPAAASSSGPQQPASSAPNEPLGRPIEAHQRQGYWPPTLGGFAPPVWDWRSYGGAASPRRC